MSYDEENLMETFDKWDDRDRLKRFVRRMEHKFNAKDTRYQRR